MVVNKQVLNPQCFWSFSLQFYAIDNNQSVFLRLQDAANLNVNQCLLLFFLMEYELVLNLEQCDALENAIQESERTTEHLRSIRKHIGEAAKGSVQYKDALKQEIFSEKKQQEALLDCLQRFITPEKMREEESEKFICEYLVKCLKHVCLSRQKRKNTQLGQSNMDANIQLITDCVERLVQSYLAASPFVFNGSD